MEPSLAQALRHAATHEPAAMELLVSLARIPSVSAADYPPAEVHRCAEAVLAAMREAGLQDSRLLEFPAGYPAVYGEIRASATAPTVLLYAHYDVQPPMRPEAWHTPAFEPTLVGDRLFGRGTADDKAGVVMLLAAVEAFVATSGRPPVNVKVLVEGEEEIGSANLDRLITGHRDLLQADLLIIADGANYDAGVPAITVSLRGLAAFGITVSALEAPLHSGLWGGPIPDPAMALAKMLASLTDAEGRIAVPGIRDAVVPPTPAEADAIARVPENSALLRSQAGLLPEVGFRSTPGDFFHDLWREPSLVVNSIEAGGRKIAGNVVMNSAWARVGLRLVPNQDPGLVRETVTRFLENHTPWGLRLHLDWEAASEPWKADLSHPVFAVAARALAAGYACEPYFMGCGASIPFVGSLSAALGGAPALVLGIEDPRSNAHSENESLFVPDLHRAVRSLIHLLAGLENQRA